MLRIGIVVSSPLSSKYAFGIAEWARDQEDLEVSALIVCEGSGKASGKWAWLARLVSEATLSLIVAVERCFLRKYDHYRDHYKSFDLGAIVKHRIHVGKRDPSGSPDGSIEEDVARVSAAGLDVLLKLHPVALDSRIVAVTRLGMVAFAESAGDARFASARLMGFSGFWECLRRFPRTRFAVERVLAPTESPQICVHGALTTEWCFSLNQAALLTKSSVYLRDTLKRLASGDLRSNADPGDLDVLSTSPTLGPLLAYGTRLGFRIMKRLSLKVLRRRSRWSIAVAKSGLEDFDPGQMKSSPNPPDNFWADPFLWSRDGETYCFVEELPYPTGRGHIKALKVEADGIVDLGVALKEDFHLSFPYLFEDEGRLYMCPETSEAGQIRLYVCEDFPLRWKLHALVMDNIPAADTMIFRYHGRWWLLTSLDRAGVRDYCYELNLFFAHGPDSRTWTPHPANPIRIDSCGGRNAGMLSSGGKLYRFAQRQGFDQYGEGLMIFEIVDLSPTRYAETLVREFGPNRHRHEIGIHHLSFADGYLATDFLTVERTDR
jgi:hypothetical protein